MNPVRSVVKTVWARANGCCERCGRRLDFGERGLAWSVHHRRPRGMGGSKLDWVNKPANLVVLCGHATTPGGCHAWVEANRVEALKDGWLVSRIGVLIAADVPVVDLEGNTFWLDDLGKREYS